MTERITMGQRGFAAMTPEKRREISARGGKAAHAQGTAHKWTPEQARAAGKIGGSTSRRGAAPQKKHGTSAQSPDRR